MADAGPLPLDDADFELHVGHLLQEAIDHVENRIRDKRESSWRRYYGEVTAQASNGGCDIVVRSIQDSVGQMLPDLLNVFLGADAVAEFLPGSADPTEGLLCHAANLAVTAAFWGSDGFLATNDALTEALVSGYGFYKVFAHQAVDRQTQQRQQLSPDQYASATNDPNTTVAPIWDQSRADQTSATDYGLFDVETVTIEEKLAIEAVPASNMYWTYAHDFYSSWLIAQVTETRMGALVEMGFTLEQLKDVTAIRQAVNRVRSEEDARENYNSSSSDKDSRSQTAGSWAAQRCAYYEVFARVDKDGDGKAELWKIWVAGDNKKVLAARPAEPGEMPWILVPCYRIPHSSYSESASERLYEFQEEETRVVRAQIDNVEMISGPLILNANGGGIDTNDLSVWKKLKVIACRSVDAVKMLFPPDVGTSILQLGQELKMRREDRSGVSRIASSLRPEDMADIQATVANAAGEGSEKKIQHLARMQAELALKLVMARILRILIKLGSIVIQVEGQPVKIDTKNFNPDWQVRVKVGLGTGTRVERSMTMMNLWQALVTVSTNLGEDNSITDAPKMRNLIEDFGAIQPGLNMARYIKSEQESKQFLQQKQQQPPQPDPKMAKVQADQQAAQAKLQAETQHREQQLQSRHQLAEEKLQAHTQLEQTKAGLKAQASQGEAQQRAQAEAARIRMEYQARQDQLELEYQMHLKELGAKLAMQHEDISAQTATDMLKIAADHHAKLQAAKHSGPPQ